MADYIIREIRTRWCVSPGGNLAEISVVRVAAWAVGIEDVPKWPIAECLIAFEGIA